MAMIKANQIMSVKDEDELIFTPREGESAVIKGVYADIHVSGNNPKYNSIFGRLSISKTSVGYIPFRLMGKAANAIEDIGSQGDLFKWAKGNGINMHYPVAEGDKFIVTIDDIFGTTTVHATEIMIIYDRYESKDISGTEPNGARSNELTYFNIMTNSKGVSANEEMPIDISFLPAEYPEFPAGVVPAKFKIDVYNIMGSTDAVFNNNNDYVFTKYLRLYFRRSVMFDEQRNGFPFAYFQDPVSHYNYYNALGYEPVIGKYGWLFKQPLEFIEGDELNIQVLTSGKGTVKLHDEGTMIITLQRIGMIKE